MPTIKFPGRLIPGRDYRPRVGGKGGPLYGGVESAEDAVAGHRNYAAEGPGADPSRDPLGVGLQQRGMEHAKEYRQQEFRKDPRTLSGPLPSPMWEGLFQAMKEKGVSKIQGGPSAPGSNQVRGQSVQPDYFTGGATFMGRQNADYQPRMFAPGQTIGGFGPTSGGTFEQEQAHIAGLKRYRV